MSKYEVLNPGELAIERFVGRYYFLNNMFSFEPGIESPLGSYVATTEHSYQMQKFTDMYAQEYIAKAPNGLESKDRARELKRLGVPERPDWADIKLSIMENVNRQKFSIPELGAKLIATADRDLIEGNNHNDTFWGVSPPRSRNGSNNLGKILMKIRAELLEAK